MTALREPVLLSSEANVTSLVAATPPRPLPASRISVLHLVHTMAYGGVETAIINWLGEMDRSQFDIHLACFDNPGGGGSEEPFVEAAKKQGLTVHKIPWGRRKPLLKSAGSLAALMDRFGVEILHTHNWYADFVGAAAKRLRPVKTISTVYVWSDYDWKRNLLQAIDRRVLRGFDIVSAHCRDTYLKTVDYGIPEDRLRLHVAGYAGKPIEMASGERLRLRRSRGVADDEILLGNVARFYPEKSHELLLESFRRIVDGNPRTRLWIAGVGPLESRIRERVRELDLESHVEFLGFVERLEEVLPLLDIQVHPATIEGVAQAVCAGMTAGLPVIASAVGGIPEIVEHERTGFLVPPNDEPALTEAILRLRDDGGLRRRLGEAARDFITDEYSLATAVRRVEQTYREVVR